MGVPPFQLDNLFEAEIGDEIEDMMRYDQRWWTSSLPAGLARDGSQRLAMQVIKMRMRDKYDIHRRQVAQMQTGLAQPFQNKKPAREVRVNDDVHPADLEEEAGMADERYAQIAV